jgi:hypothetical protein
MAWLYIADLMMFSTKLELGIVNIIVDTYIDTT